MLAHARGRKIDGRHQHAAEMSCGCGLKFHAETWADALYQLEIHFARVDAAGIIVDGDFVYVVDIGSPRFDNFGQVVVCGQHSMFVRFLDSAREGIFFRHVQVAKVLAGNHVNL